MKNIIWEDYIHRDDLKTCSIEALEKEENEIGFTLPDALKKLMMEHGGQKPVNLIPSYPSGHEMSVECIYHAYGDDDEADGYTISFITSCLVDDDYLNYVPFSHKGNVFLALDYNVRKIEPPVVFIFRDSLPDDPDHKHFLAENFDAFLEKFTV